MTNRTTHRPPNRLSRQTSPYLLQHAHNPVDWFPWGEEAFAEARRRDVPILLSVGYATCYWCHVMERECFESDGIAALMNRSFVCVKLDREERPDIDDVYMNALLSTRGSGGWPMNVFLEPATLKPFWCGTYFPPEPRGNMPGWPQVLEGLADAWNSRRDHVLRQADRVAQAVIEHLATHPAPTHVGESHVSQALQQLLASHDRIHGGFGGAPKFPQPAYIDFLLDLRPLAGDDQTADAVDLCIRKTLDAMMIGGIFDHVGGGFHRYAVDQHWTVPHFEKMLYDNAQLATVYCRAAKFYADDQYLRTARRTLDYVLREMTLTTGGFASAQDAEVDRREGLNYLWNADQLNAALAGDHDSDARLASSIYGIDAGFNFRDPHHPHEPPSNVLRLADRLDRLAPRVDLAPDDLLERLDAINARLYSVRSSRPQPITDDKVLASWSALMISALALGYETIGDPRYLDAARRAARFILSHMTDATGRLVRTSRAGESRIPAFLEDSAAVIRALVDLARVEPARDAAASLLASARRLAQLARADFRDETTGRWFDTRADQRDLFVRAGSTHDGVIPSGPSLMLHALLDLAQETEEPALLDDARDLLASLSGSIAASPTSCINATRALARALTDPRLKDAFSAQEPVATDAPRPDPASPDFLPVEVYAAVDRITVGPDQPAEFTLVLKIADGYHITAADPGPGGEGLVPLRIGVVNGSGITAYADYPPGDLYLQGLRVHRGTIELRVAVEHLSPWKGRPLLAMTYQPCTDTECLLPRTVELDVAIDRA